MEVIKSNSLMCCIDFQCRRHTYREREEKQRESNVKARFDHFGGQREDNGSTPRRYGSGDGCSPIRRSPGQCGKHFSFLLGHSVESSCMRGCWRSFPHLSGCCQGDTCEATIGSIHSLETGTNDDNGKMVTIPTRSFHFCI